MNKEFLHSFSTFKAITPFYISLAGITYPSANYHINRPNRENAVIEYVISGQGYVLFDSEYHKVEADTIYFLSQGEDHEYFADKNDPFSKIFLNISGSMARELSSLYGLKNQHIFVNKELRSTFERIPQVLRTSVSEENMQIELQLILIEILVKLSLQQKERNISEEAIILKNFIDSNTDRIISNNELSKIIFRSVDYCQKLFLKEFNTTPYAYQIDRKIMIAKDLLINTNVPIFSIGASLGYVDPHYFSNIFKSKCGCSPKHYRKEASLTPKT